MIIKLQHPKRRNVIGVELDGLDTERFYFELQADGNYETIATSEIYESREAADHAISLIVDAGTYSAWSVTDATAL